MKLVKFHSAATSALATEAFQKSNWGQIDPMVDRKLIINTSSQYVNFLCALILFLITISVCFKFRFFITSLSVDISSMLLSPSLCLPISIVLYKMSAK